MNISTKLYILFDLDGTLLPLNTDAFLEAYVKKISAHFADIVDPSVFARQLLASSYYTIANPTPGMTNRETYFADFFPKLRREPVELMSLFDQFYNNHFSSLVTESQPSPLARELVTTAQDKGYGIVMATNPIFPKEAVWERMRWANIHDLPWELVTSYENMCSCKPHPQYFTEILERIGAESRECIHIGNDLSEDMAAHKVGIPVVMVTDHLVNRHNQSLADCLYHGSLSEVLAWAKETL